MKPANVLLGLILATAVAAAVFALYPGLDLRTASALYEGHNRFVGQTPFGEAVRRVIYWVPAGLAAVLTVLYAVRRFGLAKVAAPSGRAVAIVLLSLLIGPGLLSNTLLKDHSHRPRPYQTIEFGGADAFRPFYRFDGQCARNCSFVSGEGSAAAWTVIPALLAPGPVRVIAVAASLVFATAVGALRMAFGGHYLSDTVFAALFTWIVGCVVWIVVQRSRWLKPW